MEAAENAILWLDAGGQITRQNAAATRLFQHCDSDEGAFLFDYVNDPEPSDWPETISQLRNSGSISISTTLVSPQRTPLALSLHSIRKGKE